MPPSLVFVKSLRFEECLSITRGKPAGRGGALPAPDIRLWEHIEDVDGAVIFRQACVMGLEGIVVKRRDSHYHSGRSRDWIEVKNMAHPAIERAMLIALSKRVRR